MDTAAPIGRFPDVLDSTMLADFVACPQKFFWRYCLDLVPAVPKIDLHAGRAFAAGLEAARNAYLAGEHYDVVVKAGAHALLREYGDEDMLAIPPDNPKTLSRMLGALDYYLTEAFPLPTDWLVPVSVEYTFSVELPVRHPDTGRPLLYAGRFDALCSDDAGNLFILDDKTTRALGASWSSQWSMRGQFLGYMWAIREMGQKAQGVVVRGIAILKTRYNHAEATLLIPEWRIDRWFEDMLHHLKRMVEAWKSGVFPRAYNSACTTYGLCPYTDLCMAKEPERWFDSYEQHRWSPLD